MSVANTRAGRRTGEGVITSYIHHNSKIGVLVEVNCETDFVARTDEFSTLSRQLAEHIAAAAPVAVDRQHLSRELVERKRAEFESQVLALGKPEHLVARIVEGKMEAYFRDVVLMDQEWIREPNLRIAELVYSVAAKTGENVQVRRFSRFHMGTT